MMPIRFSVRTWAAVTVAVVAFASAATSSAADADFANSPKLTFRLSSASPAGMEDSKAIVEAADFLKKETAGTVVIQPYFASSLFDEIAGMGAVQSGLVDMALACTCNMTKQTTTMLFADVPYFWKKMDNGRDVWSGEVGQSIAKDTTEKLGMIPLAYAPSGGGYRILWNTKRVVKVPADMKGLKIRTTATPIEQEFWRSMGAVPTPVDVKEIYTALQSGLVDAQHLQPVWLTLLKHDEVVKYGTEIGAAAVYRVLAMNAKSFAKMDANQKQAFAKAMKLYEDKAYEHNRSLREAAMEKVKTRGIQVYVPNAQEMAEWRKVGTAFAESPTVRSSVSKETLDQANALQK